MHNQTVLITGASTGIGKDLAVLFAKQHFNVVLIARSQPLLEELATQLKQQYSITATVIPKDLSKRDAAKEIYQELKMKNISIDILINNAGFGTYGKFHETPLNETLDMITVNNIVLIELTYLFLPDMLQKKNGKIMNVASLAAFQACPSMSVYAATKAFVLLFTEGLTEELNNTGITVTAFCPGVTLTAFQERSKTQDTRIVKSGFNIMTSEKAAQIAFAALMHNKPLIISGFMNKMMAFFTRLTPRRINVKLAAYFMN